MKHDLMVMLIVLEALFDQVPVLGQPGLTDIRCTPFAMLMFRTVKGLSPKARPGIAECWGKQE